MKKTLKQRLEDKISNIDARCDQLIKYINEYKENNNFSAAMKCDIKLRQLKMVSQSLKELLV